MRADVRLVQRRRVDDGVGALHRRADDRAIGDRAGDRGVGRLEDVQPHHLVAVAAEDADERFAEMPRAAGDQHLHTYD
jgi:hypothetical protein